MKIYTKMKNKLGLMMAAIVIAGWLQVGFAQSWDNSNFSKGNLENWDVLENEDDNIIIVRDFNVDGGFYYSTKNKNKHAEIASKKFKVLEKNSIVSISFYKSGDTDSNIILCDDNNVELEVLCSTQNAPIDNFKTREYDLSSYVGRTLYVLIEGGSANLNFIKVESRFGLISSLLNLRTGGGMPQLALSIDQKTIYNTTNSGIEVYDIKSKTLKWEFHEYGVTGDVVVNNTGGIHFYSNGRIHTLSHDGKYLWNILVRRGSHDGGLGLALGNDGILYTGSASYNPSYFNAIDSKTGAKVWETAEVPQNYLGGTPLISLNGTMYCTAQHSKVHSIDTQTGIKNWTIDAPVLRDNLIMNYGDTVYCPPGERGILTAFDGLTGEILWDKKLNRGDSVISSDGKYVFSSGYALDSKTGAIIWENKEAFGSTIVCNNGGIICFTTANGKAVIRCFSQLSGIKHWEIGPLNFQSFYQPLIDNNGTIYSRGSDQILYSLKTGSTGFPTSPWPMAKQNAQRTSRQASFEEQQLAIASPTIFKGEIIDIDIRFPGKGYLLPPKVRIVGGGGGGALARAFVSDGYVTDIIILNPGKDYSSKPHIEIDWPTFPPKQALASPQITNGFLTGFNIEDPGSGYINLPTIRIVSDKGNGAAAEAVLVRSKLSEIRVINPGSGYDDSTEVIIASPPLPPSRAAAIAKVVNGFIVELTVTNEGRKYIKPPVIQFIGRGGGGAKATAVLKDGMVVGIKLDNAGSGYPDQTQVVIAPPIELEPSIETESINIFPAIELEFMTLKSKIYQLQWSTDLINWSDDEDTFIGIGGLTSIFKSAENSNVYWRLKISNQ
jgi:hypothetical protein